MDGAYGCLGHLVVVLSLKRKEGAGLVAWGVWSRAEQ